MSRNPRQDLARKRRLRRRVRAWRGRRLVNDILRHVATAESALSRLAPRPSRRPTVTAAKCVEGWAAY